MEPLAIAQRNVVNANEFLFVAPLLARLGSVYLHQGRRWPYHKNGLF